MSNRDKWKNEFLLSIKSKNKSCSQKEKSHYLSLFYFEKKGKSSEVQSAALYEGVQRWGIREDVDGIRWAAIAYFVVGGNKIHFVISEGLDRNRIQMAH